MHKATELYTVHVCTTLLGFELNGSDFLLQTCMCECF